MAWRENKGVCMIESIVCRCGCAYERRKDLVYTKVEEKSAWRCPKHQRFKYGVVDYILYSCIDCSEIFKMSFRAAINKTRCDACQKLYAKKLVKLNNKKLAKIKRKTQTVRATSTGSSIWY